MQELLLCEEFFLFAIDEKKMKAPWWKSMVFKFGLGGAVLWDLVARGKLVWDDEKVKLIDRTPVNELVLDKAIETISETNKSKKISHWVTKLGNSAVQRRLLKELSKKGLVRVVKEQEISFWGTSKERYQVWDERPIRQTRNRLSEILLYQKKPDEKYLRLVGLVFACRLLKRLADDKEKQETARLRAKELAEEDIVKKGIRSAVNNTRVQAATSVISALFTFLKDAC